MPITKHYRIQAGVEDELARAIKIHAVLNRLRLYDVFVQAMEQFLHYRHELQKKGESVPYLSSPLGAKDLNVHLSAKLATRLRALAAEDKRPLTRLIYTALVRFAAGQNLILPVGTGHSDLVKSGGSKHRRDGSRRHDQGTPGASRASKLSHPIIS